jgi:ATP/ADP translocase
VEEIGKALVELIKSGSALAPSIMSYWFAVKIIDNLSSILCGVVVMGGLVWIAKVITDAIRHCNDAYYNRHR